MINGDQISVPNAVLALSIIQPDMNPADAYKYQVQQALLDNGVEEAPELYVVFSNFNNEQMLEGTEADDVIITEGDLTFVFAGDGNDSITGNDQNNVFYGGSGDDVLGGGTGDGTYIYRLNDGNDIISDYAYERGNDRLVFSDLTPADVTVGRDGQNLLLSLANGEVITIVNHLNGDTPWAIETIEFADGTTWDHAASQAQISTRLMSTPQVTALIPSPTFTITVVMMSSSLPMLHQLT
ncbi:calcium-binding protein [Parasulfitobacter algicola]|nr:calcium-binding protein [Sulfitobacter algicola]